MSRLSKILFTPAPLSTIEKFKVKYGFKPAPRAGKLEQLVLLIEDSAIDGKNAVKKGSKKSFDFMAHLRLQNPFYSKK